jgi:hypothetical protein
MRFWQAAARYRDGEAPWRARALAALLLALALSPQGSAAPTRANFDHLTTGFELLGQHRDLPCETCHANAMFKGTPTDCGACHGIGTAVRATAKPANHILSTDQCASCHTPIAWNPAVNFDHTQARGSCSTCHNGVQAQGKGPTHIATDLECDACHTTLTWAGAFFTHQGVTSNCAECHNGVAATGMPATHIPVGTPPVACEGCHSNTNFLTFAGTRINHAAVTALSCASCHETANFLGMHPSTNSTAGDSRPSATLDANHPKAGDCGQCHDTTSFGNSALRPANHIPTSAPCSQCHTTAGNYALYSVVGTHQNVSNCLSCHGPTVGPFAHITIVSTPGNHLPIGSLDCSGSGCHNTTNVNAGGFRLGAANIASPTLSVAGHSTVAAAVPACQTCHEAAPYLGMLAGTGTMAGDSRPSGTLDPRHPASGDCGSCHTTMPTFASDLTAGSKPANHIPTSAPCAQCHTTAGNYALYSSGGTHQGVSGCLTCHGPTVATTFANITILSTPGNHFPVGGLDCNASGCHTTGNVAPGAGGFRLGAASISSPTLSVSGHLTVAAIAACATCHESAPYIGMLASTATTAADSRQTAFDAKHPASGDCGTCHVTTPTFATNLLPTAPKPANHIPTSAVCAQCHTTAGNFALYSVTGTHQGVSGCLSCHGPTVGPFVNVTLVSTPANHFAIGSLDCNGAGCHTTTNVAAGGFRLGAASISAPTLTVAGHSTVAAAVSGCQACHETAPYIGMLASTATAAGDSRPTAFDKGHPTSGDCGSCHTTAPTFSTNQTGGSAKPSNHIPTNAACAQCHTTAGNYALYSVTGVHQGVTGCLTCHGPTVNTTFYNVTMVTTPANHFAIGSLDCNGAGCHTTTNVAAGGFRLGVASISAPTLTVAGHSTVAAAVSGCQACHETAPYIGMLASTATAAGDSRPTAFDKNHPTSGDCNACHTTTPTFSTNQTGGSAKPATHIPTSAPCAQCHTTAGNYGLYVMGATGHAGISSNCAQCHAYGLTFYNMAAPTLKQPAAGARGHIPAVPPNGTGSLACELCHSAAAFTSFAGTVMKHAYVTAMKCDSCHEYGMTWQTNSGTQLWTRPSPNHHAGQDCGGSGCHSSRDKRALRPAATAPINTARPGTNLTPRFGAQSIPPATAAVAGAPFSHRSVAATACVSCHSAASGTGKPIEHLASSDSCQTCHTTLAWLPVISVDHVQVKGTCVSCHDGHTATGKPSSHVTTQAACESCHTSNAWTPARFDHSAVAVHACTSCHNSVRAIGMPRAHVPTVQQCDTCHGTLDWKPAKVDHSGIASRCASCHNNAAALGVPSWHMRTQVGCAACHSYPDWAAVHFLHSSAAYPGNHRAALTCAACHTADTDQVPYPAPVNAGTCAGCHAKDFSPAAHPKSARALYSAHELADCSGACHVYSQTTPASITRSLPGPHHRVSDATFKH